MNNTIKEWVHTVIMLGWLIWLTGNHMAFKDSTIKALARTELQTKVLDEIKENVSKIEERTRAIEIKTAAKKE